VQSLQPDNTLIRGVGLFGKCVKPHSALIYSYKVIFGLIDIDCSRFFTVTPNETTRGHAYKLFVHHSRVDIRKHFFVIG